MITHGYRVIYWTQHWRIIDGTVYRDAAAIRLTDGQTRLISVPEKS